MNAWQPKPFLARKLGEQSHILIGDDLQYAAGNDISKMRNKGGLQCTLMVGRGLAVRPPIDAEIAKLHFFPFAAKQLHFSSSSCQRCDLDRNGKLDYQEFKAMIFRSRERKEALLREQEEQARKGQMYDLACSNQITTFLFSFSMNILFVKTPTFCFRPS